MGPDTGDRNGAPVSDLRQGSVWAALSMERPPPGTVRPTAHAAPRRGPRGREARGSCVEGSGALCAEPVWRLALVLYDHITTRKRTRGPRKPRPMWPSPQPREHGCSWVQARTTQWGSKEGQHCGNAEAGDGCCGVERGRRRLRNRPSSPPATNPDTPAPRLWQSRDFSSAHIQLTES